MKNKVWLFVTGLVSMWLTVGCGDQDASRSSVKGAQSEPGYAVEVNGSEYDKSYLAGVTWRGEFDYPFDSQEAARRLGRGFNLGNTFEAYGNVWQRHDFAATRKIIDLYKARGMRNIRIPVTWMEAHENGTLANYDGWIDRNHPRFRDLVATVDYALSQGLYVILNTHHELWLKRNYDGSEAMNQRFRRLWGEIATYFRHYPYQLMFEVLNEPDHKFGDWGLTEGVHPTDARALELTRTINQIGYEAIRWTGGNNQKRIVMVSPNGQGNHGQIDDVYPERWTLPGGGQDPYVMATVHSYDPWTFSGQTGSNMHYQNQDFDRMRADITGVVNGIAAWSRRTGVGVYFGEYGVGRMDREEERNSPLVREYYRFFTRSLIDANIPTGVWDDKGWFAVLKPRGDDFEFVYGIIDAIMGRPEY